MTRFRAGDAVAVNPSWASCGRCHMCRSGEENHCLYQKGIRAPGVGYNGGHAPYILVPEARFLVPIGDLDPVQAAPLTDAGITTYSAIKPALPDIWPGSTAVVIGVGGLGIYAGAIPASADRRPHRRGRLDRSPTEAGARLRSRRRRVRVVLTRRNRFASSAAGSVRVFVLDCVGMQRRPSPPGSPLSRGAAVSHMVGAGGGSIPFDFFKMPPGCQLVTSLNGGSIALMEVVDMAALGRLKVLRGPLSPERGKAGVRRFRARHAWSAVRCSCLRRHKLPTPLQPSSRKAATPA